MPESFLPSSMQARRDALLAQEAGNNTEVVNNEVANNDPQSNGQQQPPADNIQADVITLTREELNKLQAAADQSDERARRLEQAELDAEELRARLTGDGDPSKGSGNGRETAPPAGPDALQWDAQGDTELTAKEKEDYDEDAIRVIEKVCRRLINESLSKFAGAVKNNITHVQEVAASAGKQVENTFKRNSAKQFDTKVRAEVADVDKLTNHPDWVAFLSSRQPESGMRYRDLFLVNFEEQHLEVIKGIFDAFREKYVGKPQSNTSGYSSVPSSSNSGQQEAPKDTSKEMLKMSDRRKAQKQFINKQITAEKLDAIKAEFNKAEQENRIIYD